MNECGRVRTGTLGYQRCILAEGHEGLHRSQDGTKWDAVAAYEDGAGEWAVIRIGDTLTIRTPTAEYLTYTLAPAIEYDACLIPEFVITDRYAACDDYGPNGVVWIDGLAYTLD